MMRTSAVPLASGILPRRGLAVLLLVGLLAVWLLPLGYRDLVETDEGRYAEIPREMLASGDWVTPRLDGLKYFEKPALQYWLTAASFAAFGESEFSARLWNGIAGLLTIAAVWGTGRRLWGPRAGDYAGLATLSMAGLLAGSQTLTLDMGVSCFLSLTLCGTLLAFDHRTTAPQRRLWMLGVWAAMAAATLSKGLIGIIIPGAVLVLYSLVERQWRFWRELEWFRGGALLLLLTVPWFVLVSLRNPEFARFFFIHEHFERFLTTEHHRAGPIYYYLPLLLFGAMPWIGLLPAAARAGWKRRSAPGSLHAGRLLLLWCVFIFVFFSVSGSKLPLYILPVFPALGLLLGPYLESISAALLRRQAQVMAGLWLLAAIVAPLVLMHEHSARTPQELNATFAPWAAAGAGLFAVLAAAAAVQARRGRQAAAVALLAAAGLLALQTLNLGYQAYSPVKSTRALAEQARPYLKPQTEIFAVQRYDQTLPFYLKRTVTVVGWSGELAMGMAQEPDKAIGDLDTFKRRWLAAADAVAFASPPVVQKLRDEGLPMTVIGRSIRVIAFRKP